MNRNEISGMQQRGNVYLINEKNKFINCLRDCCALGQDTEFEKKHEILKVNF